jgi:PAS domain S-box-containing protein
MAIMERLIGQKTNIKSPEKDATDWRSTAKFHKIILDNIPVSVITIDKQGNITSVNKHFWHLSREKSFKGKNIFKGEFFNREDLVSDFKKLLADGTIVRRNDCHELNSKGEDEYLRILAVPFRNAMGEIEGAISLASDNTEAVLLRNKLIDVNKGLEDKIRERTSELDRVNAELKKVLELKSTFIADVSHEFRTSLTIMQCSTELLLKLGNFDGKNLELFNNLITEIKRVSGMLSDLSLLTKSNTVKVKVTHKKINLNVLISTLCKSLSLIADKRNIRIEHINKNLPVSVCVDKDDMERVVFNLIRNAIKYNKDNGVIRIWAEKNKKGVSLNVEDTGIGIPENEIENIFERFYQVDKSRTRNELDSGLGLAISKHIVEGYGGKITVKSKLGKGSLFSVYLPS